MPITPTRENFTTRMGPDFRGGHHLCGNWDIPEPDGLSGLRDVPGAEAKIGSS
jgi:hypothetical protein